MTKIPNFCFCLALLFLPLVLSASPATPENSPTPVSLEMPKDELKMRIKHLTTDQLENEADRWHGILIETVYELNQAKIEVKHENELLKSAQAEGESAITLAEKESELKSKTLDKVSELREKRLQIIDRMDVVLSELSAKLGKTNDNKEHETVVRYRLYINSVKGLQVDVTDTQSTEATIVAWLRSSEGGVRLLNNAVRFLAILIGFTLLGMFLSRVTKKALSLSHSASQILKKFAVDTIRRVTTIAGLLVGLAAVGVNITPLVAIIGAAGFVIAFALQDTLSNFASGLLIMFYKPFDIGDFVQTSEVTGKVKSMTLVTTNMITPDNKLLVVPNNELWGKVVTNVTGSNKRRIDLVFGIGYDDDITLAERILAEVMAAHPQVLDDPETVIGVDELGDSSVNLICRPWVKTSEYWTVQRELKRAVKERFDAEGITIPYPQRDVHLIPDNNQKPAVLK